MEAIILHKQGRRFGDLQKGLKYETIYLQSKIWDPDKELSGEIFEADVILIHSNSPDCEILKVISDIHRKKRFMPVVILDENKSEKTRERANSLGVDKYFSAPFSYIDLAIELKKLICKKESNGDHKWLRAYDLWLDLEHRFVKRESHIIPLRNKEFALLEFFIINRGKVLTRNSILEHVWDRNANFASNTVDVHINRLRKKIDDPFKNKLIHTIHCIGYFFDKGLNMN